MFEEEIPISKLVTGDGPVMQVTEGVSRRISEAEKWGHGNWDKIPWTVTVHSSVTLSVDQNHKAARGAQNMASTMAWASSQRHIGPAVVNHTKFIREEIYAALFEED